MSDPIVLSDEEEDQKAFSTPLPSLSKKPRLEPHTNHTVLVIDDDPTPQKSLPSVVPETPFSILSSSEAAIMKCTTRCPADVETRASSSEQKFSDTRASSSEQKFSGIRKFICLESDHESESGYRRENLEDNERMGSDAEQDSEWRSGFVEPTGLRGDANLMNMPGGYSRPASSFEDAIPQVHDYSDKEYMSMEQMSNVLNQRTNKNNAEKELEKLENASLKAEAAELREHNNEKQVLENDKVSLRSIAAETDTRELEVQSVGGVSRLICLESDDESENDSAWENWKENETEDVGFDPLQDSEWRSGFIDFTEDDNMTNMPGCSFSHQTSSSEDLIHQIPDYPDKENMSMDQMRNVLNQNGDKVNAGKKHIVHGATRKKKIPEEDRAKLMEEKKQKKEQEKLRKAALKAEAAELKRQQKERKKWENGKLALKCIVAEIDSKVLELQSVGGPLLSRFAEKGLTYRITSNPIERSIVWTMNVPDHISETSSNRIEIPYVLLIKEAEEICNLVANGTFLDHVSGIRSRYPSHTVCYLTNRLMTYITKREKEQYKNPTNNNRWRRPPVEEAMAKLTTHFVRVHSRHCLDEAELAEHVVGLTSSLASCQFRKKLTRLSVNANGSIIPKDSVDKKIINKSPWLKALVAIPKVQPRFAIAIWKKYPTMKSLLRVYMDPLKSVHEKEFLLKDLVTEGLVGGDRRLGEVCSKRVYRILMAHSGTIKTDDVEDGADFFRHQPSSATPSCNS